MRVESQPGEDDDDDHDDRSFQKRSVDALIGQAVADCRVMGIDVGGECCFLAMAVVRLAAQKDQGGGEDAAPMGRIVGGWSFPIPNVVWASASALGGAGRR
jgi:hypothetical protein